MDVFRGATMAAMVIVNTPGDWSAVYPPFLHAAWHGWTPTDLIFPFFVFVVGVSIVLSKRSTGSVGVIARRAVLLFLLGLFLALYPRFDFSTVRIMGVLQRLAICYFAAAIAYRAVAKQRRALTMLVTLDVAAALLVVHWILLTYVPAPGGAAGDLTPDGNLGAWIDRAVFGEAHLWRQSRTWDPEGLLSTLPAIATALTGVAAGVVLTSRADGARRAAILAIAGALSAMAGWLWGLWFPINKNLWTSSYVLFTSGLASMALAAVFWIVDVRGHRRLARPFVVMGVNALVLFVVSGLLVKTLLLVRVADSGARVTLYSGIYRHVFAPMAAPRNASLMFAVAALVILYLMLEVMYRRRWFLRV